MNQLWQAIRQDLDRYRVLTGHSHLRILLTTPGAQASLVYRLGHWLYDPYRTHRLFVRVARVLYFLMYRWVEITTGISLNPRANIGPGLYIGHFGGIFVGAGVSIGKNCNLSQGVTIGIGGRGSKRGSPQLANRIYVGPGAKVFGPITIGDDVAIGANAVVLESVPARAVVGGVPAQIISFEGSFDFVRYSDMHTDPDRLASLNLISSIDADAELH